MGKLKEKQNKENFYEKARGDSLQELAGKIGPANVPGTRPVGPASSPDPPGRPERKDAEVDLANVCPIGTTELCYCKETYRCPPCNEREVER